VCGMIIRSSPPILRLFKVSMAWTSIGGGVSGGVVRESMDNYLKADKFDKEGFRPKTMKERAYRTLAMTVFIIVYPFVFIFLGIYRAFSLLGATSKDL